VVCGYEGHLAINGVAAYTATTCKTTGTDTNFRLGWGVSSDATTMTSIINTPVNIAWGSSSLTWTPTALGKTSQLNLVNNASQFVKSTTHFTAFSGHSFQ